MANINKQPSYQSQKGYSGFDMSFLSKFSSTVGELLPVCYDILFPGDKVSLQTEIRTRTMELASASMCKIKEHLDWFFVPMTQIYSIFGDWYFDIKDFKSSNFFESSFPQSGTSTLPYFQPSHMKQISAYLKDTTDVYFAFPSSIVKGNSFRLLEMLGYPVGRFLTAEDNSDNPDDVTWASFCPILLCAYNKIYSDYYRLSDREPNFAVTYNLDRFYSVPQGIYDDLEQIDLDRMFALKYRPWKRDYFTNLYQSPLFDPHLDGGISFPDANYSLVNMANDYLDTLGHTATQPNGLTNTNFRTATSVAGFNPANSALGNSVQNIRTSFAIEKLLEVTRRAGKHVDAQTLAHFGVKPNMGISGECIYIGSATSDINIGDVIATSSGDGVSLGEVGGKGYGYGKGSKLKFTAPFHGVLMCIYSAVPEVDYYAVGLDPLNQLMSRESWPTQEFDNLGMEPLFKSECQIEDVDGGGYITTRYGWRYRYFRFKNNPNRIYGALNKGRSLSYWTTGRLVENSRISDFLIDPTFLNPIMLRDFAFHGGQSSSTWFADDPLIHECYFDYKKSSKFSTYGLPSL